MRIPFKQTMGLCLQMVQVDEVLCQVGGSRESVDWLETQFCAGSVCLAKTQELRVSDKCVLPNLGLEGLRVQSINL